MGNKSAHCFLATGTSEYLLMGSLCLCMRQGFEWQVLTYNGFYDDNLEFVGLEGVQMVASMTAGSAMGRHLLTTRFTSIVRICSVRCGSRWHRVWLLVDCDTFVATLMLTSSRQSMVPT